MSKKVYLVDDDVDLVESMTMALENAGCEVKSQNDDKNLVENIRAFNPELIILDVMFPDDDGAGFKMARAIAHHDGIKNIPILMLSGVNKEGAFPGTFTNKDIDDVYMPVTEFIEKPIDPDALVAKVEEMTK
jgi:DNA-binding response OmpR family regulator